MAGKPADDFVKIGDSCRPPISPKMVDAKHADHYKKATEHTHLERVLPISRSRLCHQTASHTRCRRPLSV